MDCGRYYDLVGESSLHQRDLYRFERTINHLLKKGSLLDVGCGCGYWLEYLHKRTELSLLGEDISPVRLNIAKKNVMEKNIALSVSDARILPHRDDQFEQTTALEVLEHIPDWKKSLDEIIRVTSNRIIITVPYNEQLQYETCSFCNHKIYMNGHLNSFNEDSFHFLEDNFVISFDKFTSERLSGYFKRVAKELIKKFNDVRSDKEQSSSSTICGNCYETIPYNPNKFKSRIKNLLRIINGSPAYLLVQIDK